ncbi:MAG TPA: EAL domain-containing protein [Solirubrobacteraceae bacterium]|jgi:diguanylate cyclase (GGDEF)-like protein/PAS domain S-box-containing protein|nr:EAL domain-containing protein [Solirubrobacteraceae bacterium]
MGPHTTSIGPDAGPEPTLESEGRIARLFEMTSDLLATISLDGRFTLLNPAWEQLLGWTIEELQAHPIHELMHPDDVEPTLALMLAGTHHPAQMENFTTRYRHRDGSWRWLLWSARCDGDTWYAAARDVTDRMWLERQALHDPLTRLPNRLLLMDRARQALMRLNRSNGVVAILFIDLDRFKAVNDNLGHEVGDQLLVGISERLAEMMRDSDTVARLGGDEFVILAEDIENDGEALALAERVVLALEEPFQLGSTEVSMLASVGVSVSHDPEADPEAMLREADVAMYRAKRTGGRGLELFDESLRQEAKEHLKIEGHLREALPRHELLLAYQPILPLAGGRAVGCEALLRWHPRIEGSDVNQLLPSTFLPLAADSELIVQIGNWVLHTACAQAERWRRAGIAIPISINISARELIEMDLAERVREELTYCRLPGRALCLEVSEEAVMRDPERAREALTDVKRLGVAIALDNVGAGHSSLSLPRNLPVDMIKIDRELIQTFDRDKDRRGVFAAAIAMSQQAGLTAVAVGIETRRQLALARELDCSMGQGFLLHQPAPAESLRLREAPGAVTSAPWRPLVRLRGSRLH